MIWLGVLALVLAAALLAAFAAWRGARRPRPPAVPDERAVERGEERRSAAAPPPPAPGVALGERLREAVARQHERAGRLTAGHVQLIDVGAMIDGANAVGLSPAKALAVAEEVARRMTRASDVIVRMAPDGLAILFDGVDRQGAESRSRAIAEATLAALGEVGAGGRYLAEGFGYELDEVLDGAVIDTVEDLVRFIHIAHRSYVAKQRGVARQLEQGVSLVRRSVLSGNGSTVVGHEVAAFRSTGEGGRVSLRDESFAQLDAALGAETDCVVLEKLAAAAGPVLAEGGTPIYVPLRLTSLVNPLYLDNVKAALDALPAALRQRLVPVIDPGTGPTRGLLPRGRELLRSRVAAVAVRVTEPSSDIGAAVAAGATTVVLDAAERRFEKPGEIIGRFRGLARDAGLTAVLFGAGDGILRHSAGLAYSRAGPSS